MGGGGRWDRLLSAPLRVSLPVELPCCKPIVCVRPRARALFLRLKVPQYRDGLVGAARQNLGGLFMRC